MACKDCASPAAFWDGKPKGKELKLGGYDAYLSLPKSSNSKAIVIFPDVYGWEAPNIRLLADKFADNGFTVGLPDFFEGDKVPLEELAKGNMPAFMDWYSKHEPEVVIPIFDKVVQALSADYGVKSVGVLGICWGGRFILELGATDKVKAVVMNHGSLTEKEHVEALKQPILINASDNDKMLSREKLAVYQSILDCKKDLRSDVKFFEGMQHGWTVRGDASDAKVGPMIVEAYERALGWFQKHL